MTTKAIVTIIAALVAAVLALLYGTALFLGRASMPAEFQTALLAVISAATSGFIIYMQVRSARIVREESVRQADIVKQNSDRNANDTQERLQMLERALKDGFKTDLEHSLKQSTATTVDESSRRMTEILLNSNLLTEARQVARQIELDAQSRATALLNAADAKAATVVIGAKVDAVAAQQASTPVAVTDPNATIQANTAAIEANTTATDSNTTQRDTDVSAQEIMDRR